uniref:Uncharacterized protein n=1 Tax=Arundo donax TaxID=35708 RepID=A0A0A9EZP3_ARUDO
MPQFIDTLHAENPYPSNCTFKPLCSVFR